MMPPESVTHAAPSKAILSVVKHYLCTAPQEILQMITDLSSSQETTKLTSFKASLLTQAVSSLSY